MPFAEGCAGHEPKPWARRRAAALPVACAAALVVAVVVAPRPLAASGTTASKTKAHAHAARRPAPKGKRSARAAKPAATAKAKAPATDPSSTWLFHKPANVVPNQQGKLVVFAFRNDDYGGPITTQVGQLFEARGLEVLTNVRPVDSAEQYRDVATQLDLVAYVDGDVRGGDARTKVTLRLRSGFTGRTVTQATFTESRANLPRELSDNLWKKLGPALARACRDAATKPRRRSRNMLKINAGTPIETVPRVADDTN